ncbi:hypothetical protein NDU88_004140 [Pleurodeles waltl]|uniref:Uncharacterized protein n=1 Tax=Pleurodeles waltl TaxID=8319 RepID=A0AAV7W859_PLEWA|nr:hypothetical protein NDU88_004140 [Pleurodeles waltl]
MGGGVSPIAVPLLPFQVPSRVLAPPGTTRSLSRIPTSRVAPDPAPCQRGPWGEGAPAAAAVLLCSPTQPSQTSPVGRLGGWGGLSLSARTRVSARRNGAAHLVPSSPLGAPPGLRQQESAGIRPRLLKASRCYLGLQRSLPAGPSIRAQPRRVHLAAAAIFFSPSRDRPDCRADAGRRISACSFQLTSRGAPGSQGSLSQCLFAPSDLVN